MKMQGRESCIFFTLQFFKLPWVNLNFMSNEKSLNSYRKTVCPGCCKKNQ